MLQWLTDGGPGLPPEVRQIMLAELFSSPVAVMFAVMSGALLNTAALLLQHSVAFAVFLALDLACAAGRIVAVGAVARAAERGLRTPTDIYLLLVILWCALQGTVAFAAMRSNSPPLQILAAATIMGLIGPICARNYAAPRFAFMLICLCDLPFAAGAAVSGEPWLLILVLQTPTFLYSSMQITARFRALAVATLKAEHENKHRARHDPLTGLLNRLGLGDTIYRLTMAGQTRFATLCLDLDGFKQVNDTLGHHVGDALLQAVARRLEANVRPQDSVIRLGGDEFVILAEDLAPGRAQEFAERVIEQATGEPFLLEGTHLVRVGLSIGYACAPADGTEFESLHRKADAALYCAKAAGKGLARRFEPESRSERRSASGPTGLCSSVTSQAG